MNRMRKEIILYYLNGVAPTKQSYFAEFTKCNKLLFRLRLKKATAKEFKKLMKSLSEVELLLYGQGEGFL